MLLAVWQMHQLAQMSDLVHVTTIFCLHQRAVNLDITTFVFTVRLPEDDLMFASDSQEEDAMIRQV